MSVSANTSPLESPAKRSIWSVFRYANGSDIVLATVGTLGGAVTGGCIPLFNLLFGKILDKLNGSDSEFREGVNEIALLFTILGIIAFFSALLQVHDHTALCPSISNVMCSQVYCWSSFGERQSQKLREAYVRSILRQEVGWFDVNGSANLATKVADLCGKVWNSPLCVALYLHWLHSLYAMLCSV